ncbi:ribonuclease III domain-containing protein [Podospora conica]|nr:ribonuclease III domain-containing protein [Schizothecium conicum]
MPKMIAPAIAVFLFQLAGCAYQPPDGDQTLRVDKLTGQVLVSRPRTCCSPAVVPLGALRPARPEHQPASRRAQSTAATAVWQTPERPHEPPAFDPTELPSPLPERALQSAKLAALHARLSLPQKIPLQTLARTLVDASADSNLQFNNANLAFVGQTLINYHVTEWIMVRYPRLPMSIVWEAVRGFAGEKALFDVAKSWGVESAAAPGGEVDPGLLQFSLNPKDGVTHLHFGYERVEAAYLEKYKWRRGISNRVVFDDDFGDAVKEFDEEEDDDGNIPAEEDPSLPAHMNYGTADTRLLAEKAHATFVRALVGAVYTHCGREAAKTMVRAHVLSRTLDLERLFAFKLPTVELAKLCAREDFEAPTAHLLSETGRASRTPVFVVGIYSGRDKLGEAAGPNLDAARWKAAINSLKAWYLYSPGEHVRMPSEMLTPNAKPWEPAYIDMGEVVSR